MSSFSRRDLLKGGLLAAGSLAAAGFAWDAGALGSTSGAATTKLSRYRWATPVAKRAPDSLPFPSLPAGTDTMPEIEHIVVLMMENHSYDNYLGMLGRGDGLTRGSNGRPTNTNPTATGDLQESFHMPRYCQQDAKPSQEWQASHEQYASGKNDGFVTSPSGPVAMGYWTHKDLPFYYSLASTFPLADRWFCSLLGQTWPNRRYLIAATSGGMVDNLDSQVAAAPANGTIFDRLSQYGISWRDYYHTDSSPTTAVWLSDAAATSPNVVSIDAFFGDAAAGNLPGFCIVDPNYEYGSEEDPQDISVGEAFSSTVVQALLESPAWSNTLLVWTYDEHGGYYDHVPPPPALAPDSTKPMPEAGESDYAGFKRYGFRVPTVVVSPYARKDYVSHSIYDQTSILAMVERKWNLPALTYRDANANDLMGFLDFDQPGFTDPPTLAAPASDPRTCLPGSAGTIPPASSILPPHRATSSTAKSPSSSTVA